MVGMVTGGRRWYRRGRVCLGVCGPRREDGWVWWWETKEETKGGAGEIRPATSRREKKKCSTPTSDFEREKK